MVESASVFACSMDGDEITDLPNELKCLLETWGFEKYTDAFLENEVDLTALPLLDNDHIKQLIPHIGPQAKFKKCLADWKSNTQQQLPNCDFQTDGGLQKVIQVNGESVHGLQPSLTSPVISDVVSSPSSSRSSSISTSQEINDKGRDLISLLDTTPEGKQLLTQRLNPLGDQLRRSLTRQIATEIVHYDPKAPVTCKIYMHWITEIKRVFPAENTSIYYTKGPEVFGRPHGRLFDAVTNLKSKYRRNKIYHPRARRCLDKTLTPTTSSVQHLVTNKRTALVREDSVRTSENEEDLDFENTEIEESIEWLRSTTDNYTLCAEKWAITRKRRQQCVLSETYPYLREFPCLQRSWGYTLLVADFEEWYGNGHSFANKFPILKNKLISIFDTVSNKSTFVKKLKELAKNPDQETSNLAALLMIPHLLGPVQIKKKKCSTAEARESFITHIEEERLLNEERQKRHDKNKARGFTVQPYVVVAGPLENITASVSCLLCSQVLSQQASFLEAVSGLLRDTNNLYNGEPPDAEELYSEYDFIIIGAGTAGCVLSNRLTEVGQFKVLLIEAGGSEQLFMDIPVMATMLQFTDANWDYHTEPQRAGCMGMRDGRCSWPRGRVVGGSSVLHSMMHTRGNRKDYDRWAANGNPGWDYASVLKYFKKSENIQVPELRRDKVYHSTKGEMTLQYPSWRTRLSDAFLKAGVETGGKTVDYNGERQIGYSIIQFTMNNGTRMSASRAFLHPIKYRKNFHVTKNAMVTRILIDPWTRRAYGVEFRKADRRYVIKATREVILSAGAINSPQILMISGIGPRDHLTEKNIKTIVDLPVGYNLQDHWALGGLTFLINTTDSIRSERVATFSNILEYFSHHTGPLSAPSGTEAIAFIDTKNPNDPDGYPDLELLFVAGSLVSQPSYKQAFAIDDRIYDEVYGPIQDRDTWMVFPMLLLPESKGRIMLKNKNPYTKPLIYANYFSDGGHDQKVILHGIRKIIELSQTKAFQRFGSRLHDIPLPNCAHHKFNSDAYWYCAMKTITNTIYHHCCTAKMGPRNDPEAVVDSRLKVYGVKGLRVVDASVMPHVPAAHTNAPTLMIAEKAADMIKEDWGIRI